ncbi:MAG: paraquat-inducible protein A [Candidatus Omnitrophica bacterium]|nr:paraquat-inducible protein A [Candidatus Omnitrophota bacterium]
MSQSPVSSLRTVHPRRFEIPLLIVTAFGMLMAGLNMPLMNIQKMVFWKNEYSVITGTLGLYQDKEYFLAALIFFFSIVFPILKLILLTIVWFGRFDDQGRDRMLKCLAQLGKWSMLDVFVVAVMVVAVKLGPMAQVTPKAGIYVFSSAILLSLLTTELVERLARSR